MYFSRNNENKQQRVLQSRVSAGTIGETSSSRGKEIALIDMSILHLDMSILHLQWHQLAVLSDLILLQLLNDLMFHLLTNKNLMKCIKMKYMGALSAGRTKSVTCGRD